MFTIRVYGILINDRNQVLVSDEHIRGSYYTKFPGGGLELGEGTRDCLKREFIEEMNLKINAGRHIYTTDFYQRSAFNPSQQIIAIYYEAIALDSFTVRLRSKSFDFDEDNERQYGLTGETECFRFVDWAEFSAESVTLPIDKIVADLVKNGG